MPALKSEPTWRPPYRWSTSPEAVADAVGLVARSAEPHAYAFVLESAFAAVAAEATLLGFFTPAGYLRVALTATGEALAVAKDPVSYAEACAAIRQQIKARDESRLYAIEWPAV